jgi:hypothetical protein
LSNNPLLWVFFTLPLTKKSNLLTITGKTPVNREPEMIGYAVWRIIGFSNKSIQEGAIK